ncbi:MAG: GAK system ATP-grasp enzyme [Candidatus Goldbacteria bacterium]|nr:GAK system ATP-grasp enzyme [Candidatus Goldiibacteriota bacterium]
MKKTGVIGIPGGWSTEKMCQSIKAKTGSVILIDMAQVTADFEKNTLFYKGEDLSELDAVIIKKIDSEYSPACIDRLEMAGMLKRRGVKVFSDPDTMKQMIGRLSCTASLREGLIPMPPTFVTADAVLASEAVRDFGKAVLKPLFSTKARGMKVIDAETDNVDECVSDFIKAGNPIIYIQKIINIADKDLGITFIGDEYIGTYARMKNEGAWNTTINSGGKYVKYNPSDEIINLARKARDIFKLDFTCVDVVEAKEGIFVFEVSAFGGFRGLLDACGIDAAGIYADYVLKEAMR